MGMIEKAIKHFEALQKRYTKQHNGKMCEYVKIALDAMYKENELVPCKDCRHIEISGCYGECGKAYLGIVKPWDFCSKGERKSE